MGVGSKATRKYILAKEKISQCFAERLHLIQTENRKVLVPSSHCLIGIKVYRVVLDRIGSKLVD